MAERVIKTTIELDGEKAFKAAISGVNSELKVFDSELKLVASEFGTTGQGMKGLQATADVLTKKVEAQQAKVNALKTAVADSGKAYDEAKSKYSAAEQKLEEMTKTFGENSEEARRAAAELNSQKNAVEKAEKAYNGYQVQLNNTQAELNKTTKKLGETEKAAKDLKNLKLKDLMPEKVAKEVEKVAKSFAKVATQAGKAAAAAAKIGGQAITKSFQAGTKALTAYGSAAVAAGTAIVKMTGDAAQAADDLNTMSKQTGLSTEQLQKMQYAADLIDVDVETITGSMAKLTKNMTSSSEAVTGAFEKLGVSVRDDVTGELRNNEDVFNDLIAALGTVENETERDNLAMQIFGKSAQELNPLILGGAEALKQLGDEAEASGLILSQSALNELNAYNDSLDKLKANAAASGNIIATAFAPRLKVLTDSIGKNLPSIADSFGKMFSGDITAGQDFRRQIKTLTTDLVGQINEMLPDLLNGLNTVIVTIAENAPDAILTLLPTLIDGLTDLAEQLVDQVPTIVPQIVEGAVTLFTGLIGGLNKVITKLTPMLPQLIRDVCDTLIDNAPLIIETGFDLLVNLINGIVEAIPALVEKTAELIPVMVDGLMDNLPKLVQAGIDLIIALAKALPVAIPAILEAIPEIIKAIIGAFAEVDWVETGKDIFSGLGEGFESIFSGALGIIDSLLGTNLQQWYDEITAFWYDAGKKLYEVLHADELAQEESKNKAEELKYDIFRAENDFIKSGMTASEAFEAAKNQIVDTAEEMALFDQYLKDTVTEAEAAERYATIQAARSLETGASMSANTTAYVPSNVPKENVTNYTFNNNYYKKATPAEQRKDQQQQQEIAELYSA